MPKPRLTRDQLAKFLPNHESIRAFEILLDSTDEASAETINSAIIGSGTALSAAYSALSEMTDFAQQLLGTIAAFVPSAADSIDDVVPVAVSSAAEDNLLPALQFAPAQDDIAPRPNIGTLGFQNNDDVNIQGGIVNNAAINDVLLSSLGVQAELLIGGGKIVILANTLTLTSVDGATLNIGGGGTLGTAAYTDTSSYLTPTYGSWTPGDGSGAGLSFTVALGVYAKIGKLVFVSGRVTFPVTASTLDCAFINLPFTCGSLGNPQYNAAGTIIGGGTASKIGPDRGSTIAYLYTTGATGATNAGQSGQTLDFSFTYLTI